MLTASAVEASFPRVAAIGDARLRRLVVEVWEHVSSRNPIHRDLEAIPLHPTLPIVRHGSIAAHVRAMARLTDALVPAYAAEWGIALDLDAFRTAAYIHDAAKVIEFVERDGGLVATGGFNHALEGARIARELGAPEAIAHMVEAHTFVGPLVQPRTREAQLFLFLDVLCVPVFPERGEGVWPRHLGANRWGSPP